MAQLEDDTRSMVTRVSAEIAQDSEGWDDPVTLPGTGDVAPFPVNVLGEPVASFVRAVATETGTPVDLPAMAVLGVCSTIIGGSVVVEADAGWRSSVNLYLQALVASGEGKTPVVRRARSILDDIERDRRDRVMPQIVEAEARRRVAEGRRKDAERRAATAEDRVAAEREVIEAAQEAAKVTVPAAPRLYAHEATPEALIKLLADQGGNAGVVTSEGAEFFEMASRYSATGKGNLGIYLEGHDGGRYVSDRAGRDPIVIDRATLTACLFTQTTVLETLGKDRAAAGRGLFARFLWALPTSKVGWRTVDSHPVPESVVRGWERLMMSLGTEAEAEDVSRLALDADSARMFLEWRNRHEPRLRPGSGDLAPILDWANKLPGQVLRLAGNLHALRIGTLQGTVIDETMAAAIELADYFVDHARNAFGLMGADSTSRDAHAVMRWLRGRAGASVRDVYASKTWEPDRARLALGVLERYGWVRWMPHEKQPGRPSERFSVHPKLRYKTVQNPTGGGVSGGFVPEIPESVSSNGVAKDRPITREATPVQVPTARPGVCVRCGISRAACADCDGEAF